MTIETLKKLPDVLATNRGYLMSDAVMSSLLEDGTEKPLEVYRQGVRGTKNNKKKGDVFDESKSVANLQVIDVAKLAPNATAMMVRFSIAFNDLSKSLSSVAGEKSEVFRENLSHFINRAKDSDGIEELSRRYARNIMNGRWLWRNREEARHIEINVTVGEKVFSVDNALDISLMSFDDYLDQEIELGKVIAGSLKGDPKDIRVEAKVKFISSGGVSVYPSQNYFKSDDKDSASRSLYVVNHFKGKGDTDFRLMGTAAIRDQKVANAIRTVDTWYESDLEVIVPIPVEQYGANIEYQQYFRKEKKKNAYHFLRSLPEVDPNSGDGMFTIACLVRGAVYAGD